MPMFKALDLCPSAVVIPPDMAKYVRGGPRGSSRDDGTNAVEPLSIDEAFLDLSGTELVHGMMPAKVLARFASQVERDIGIAVSVGLSVNKFLAKIASDLDKPRGFAALDQEEARAMLVEQPVGFIYGRPCLAGESSRSTASSYQGSAAGGRDRSDEAVRPPKRTAAVAVGAVSTIARSWPIAEPRRFQTKPRWNPMSVIFRRWRRSSGGCAKKVSRASRAAISPARPSR